MRSIKGAFTIFFFNMKHFYVLYFVFKPCILQHTDVQTISVVHMETSFWSTFNIYSTADEMSIEHITIFSQYIYF